MLEKLSQCVYDPISKKVIAETDFGVFEFLELSVGTKNAVLLKPCPFLKEGRCEVYDLRPKSCREYPFTEKGDLGIGCIAFEELMKEVKRLETVFGKLVFAGTD